MNKIFATAFAATICMTGTAMADQPLSGAESNPVKMGWMQGFPPPADKIIRFTDPDYFSFPQLRWTVCHFRELMPTVGVATGTIGPRALPQAPNPALDAVTFTPLGATEPMTWAQAFDANYTDGIIVLHHGRVVYERYDGCLEAGTLHGAMSVTKSLTGLLGQMLVTEGALDETALVGDLIPELKSSAFGDATVRQVMDMTTALDYSEDYADPNAQVWVYAEAGSPLPKPEGYTGPRSYFDYLQTVEKAGSHGDAFGYKTINSDALGWLIARATGKSVAALLEDRIWSRIGAEREAFYTVDSTGTPFSGGGFNATLRDMARLGQVMLDEGQLDGEQIIPQAAIDAIRHGGNSETFAKAGYDLLPGWTYGSMWWISNDDHGAYAARGVHGQTIWIDPAADMVIVRFASNPVAANAASDSTSLPAYRAMADHLMANDDMPLVGRDWQIEDIAGAGVIDDSHASLRFMVDGRVSGSATCNQIIGSYQTTGADLKFSPLGSTMMACPEALMAQERALLDLLPLVTSYQIDQTGALMLMGPDGVVVTARRP
ncbi:MAG: serine hydrolase [Paracoccaceae bacterium]